jgi:serine/threonine protein phosphatase PrpC
MSGSEQERLNDTTDGPEGLEGPAHHGSAGNGIAAEVAPDRGEVPGASPRGELSIRYFGQSDVGLIREHNEDNFLVANLEAEVRGLPEDGSAAVTKVGARGMLIAVCDGMGGAAAGEVASQMAVDTLFEVMQSGEAPADREDFARRLVYAVEEAGNRIFSAAKMDRSRRGMGTTATVAGLVDHVLFVGQVGDSRCYVLRNGELGQISKDQSLVNQLIEAGQLTEEEADAFEHSNIILQALGTTEQVSVDLTFLELRQGDRIMLCSDGLSGLVHAEMIREVMAETPDVIECCNRLIEMANAGGGHDNITCIVADFFGAGLSSSEGAPSVGYQRYPKQLGSAEDDAVFPPREPTMKTAPPKPGADVKRGVASGAATSEGGAASPASAFPWTLLAVVGVLLIVVGALAFLFAGREDPAPEPRPATPPSEAHAAPVADPVEVRVRTDVPGAHLFVDGDDLGPIDVGEDVMLEVVPGAYRFEARVGGDAEATVVLTVRPGVPVDVDLRLPAGAVEGDTSSPSAPAPQAPAPSAPAPSAAAPSPGVASPSPSAMSASTPSAAPQAPAPSAPPSSAAPQVPAPSAPAPSPAAPAPSAPTPSAAPQAP